MDFMTKEEFINKSNLEIIQKLMERNNGYITAKELENFDISRNYLSIMTKKNMIEKVAKGIYIDSCKIKDVYYVLSVSTPKIIYSHMTALYFHNLSIKAPDSSFDITVTKKYNNPKLKKHNVFYVDDKFYNIGITEAKTPQGNKVRVYDVERCICDIIRSKKRMDIDHNKYEFEVSGDKLQYVTIPVGYQHSINNIGNDELVLILWANELFDPNIPDTYVMEV